MVCEPNHSKLLSIIQELKSALARCDSAIVDQIAANCETLIDQSEAGLDCKASYLEHMALGELEAFARMLENTRENLRVLREPGGIRSSKLLEYSLPTRRAD